MSGFVKMMRLKIRFCSSRWHDLGYRVVWVWFTLAAWPEYMMMPCIFFWTKSCITNWDRGEETRRSSGFPLLIPSPNLGECFRVSWCSSNHGYWQKVPLTLGVLGKSISTRKKVVNALKWKGILLIWSTKWSLFIKLFAWMGCKSGDESNEPI